MGTDVSASVTSATESAGYFATDATTHVCSQEQIFSPITVRKGGGGVSLDLKHHLVVMILDRTEVTPVRLRCTSAPIFLS